MLISRTRTARQNHVSQDHQPLAVATMVGTAADTAVAATEGVTVAALAPVLVVAANSSFQTFVTLPLLFPGFEMNLSRYWANM